MLPNQTDEQSKYIKKGAANELWYFASVVSGVIDCRLVCDHPHRKQAQMTTLTRRRIRIREPFDPVLSFCAGVGSLARWLAGQIPERTIERYTGHFGADNTGKLYDQMTPREHDECGAFWSGIWEEK